MYAEAMGIYLRRALHSRQVSAQGAHVVAVSPPLLVSAGHGETVYVKLDSLLYLCVGITGPEFSIFFDDIKAAQWS